MALEAIDMGNIVDENDHAMYDQIVIGRTSDILQGDLHRGPPQYYWPTDWQHNIMYYIAEKLADLSKRIIAGHHHLEELGNRVYEFKGLHDSLMATKQTRHEIKKYIDNIPRRKRGFLQYNHYGETHNMANEFVRAFRHLRHQEISEIVQAYVDYEKCATADKSEAEIKARSIVEKCLVKAAADSTFDDIHRDLFGCLCKPHMMSALHHGLKMLKAYVVLLEWTSEWKNMLLLWKHPCGPLKLLRTADANGFLPLYQCELDDPFEGTPRYLHLSRLFLENGEEISQQANNTMSYLTASDCHMMILQAWFRPIVRLNYPSSETPEELKRVLKLSNEDIAAMNEDERILYDLWTKSQKAYEAKHKKGYKDPVMNLRPPQNYASKFNVGTRGYGLFQVPTVDGRFVTTVHDNGEITREWKRGDKDQLTKLKILDTMMENWRKDIDEYEEQLEDLSRRRARNQLIHDKKIPHGVTLPEKLLEKFPEELKELIVNHFKGRVPNLDEWVYMKSEDLEKIAHKTPWWIETLKKSVQEARKSCEDIADFKAEVLRLVAQSDKLEDTMRHISQDVRSVSDQMERAELHKQYNQAEKELKQLFTYAQQDIIDERYALEDLIDEAEANIEREQKRRDVIWEKLENDNPTDAQLAQEPLRTQIAQLEEKLKYLANALINKKKEATNVTNRRVEDLLKKRLYPVKYKLKHRKVWEALEPFFQQLLEAQERLSVLEDERAKLMKTVRKARSPEQKQLLTDLDDDIKIQKSNLKQYKNELVLQVEELMENQPKQLTHILEEISQIKLDIAKQQAENDALLPQLRADLLKLEKEQQEAITAWADYSDGEEADAAQEDADQDDAEQEDSAEHQQTKPVQETTAEKVKRWIENARQRAAAEAAKRKVDEGHKKKRGEKFDSKIDPNLRITLEESQRRANTKTPVSITDLPAFKTILDKRLNKNSQESAEYAWLESEKERTEKQAIALTRDRDHLQVLIENYELDKNNLGDSRPKNEIEAAKKHDEAKSNVLAAKKEITELFQKITANKQLRPKNGRTPDPNSRTEKKIKELETKLSAIQTTLPNLQAEEEQASKILTKIQHSSKRKEHLDSYLAKLKQLNKEFQEKNNQTIDDAKAEYKEKIARLKETNKDFENKREQVKQTAINIVINSVNEYKRARARFLGQGQGQQGSGRPGVGYHDYESWNRDDDYDDVESYLDNMTPEEQREEFKTMNEWETQDRIDKDLRDAGYSQAQIEQFWADRQAEWEDQNENKHNSKDFKYDNDSDQNRRGSNNHEPSIWGNYNPGAMRGQGRGEQRAQGQDLGGGKTV